MSDRNKEVGLKWFKTKHSILNDFCWKYHKNQHVPTKHCWFQQNSTFQQKIIQSKNFKTALSTLPPFSDTHFICNCILAIWLQRKQQTYIPICAFCCYEDWELLFSHEHYMTYSHNESWLHECISCLSSGKHLHIMVFLWTSLFKGQNYIKDLNCSLEALLRWDQTLRGQY